MPKSDCWGGKTYDLSHLEPIRMEVEYEEKKVLVKRMVTFLFSCHCYSRSPVTSEDVSHDMVVMDGNCSRVFSEERYELSRLLPDLVRDLPNQKIYQTEHRNYLHLPCVDKLGQKFTYLIAIRIKKGGGDILVRIESAYPIDKLEDRRKRDKPMRFKVALSKA